MTKRRTIVDIKVKFIVIYSKIRVEFHDIFLKHAKV